MSLPKPQHAIAGGALPDKIWFDWFLRVDRALQAGTLSAETLAESIRGIALALGSPDGTWEAIPDQDRLFVGQNGVQVSGTDPVLIELEMLDDTGVGAALYKITRDAYGRVEGTQAAVLDDLSDVSAPSPTTGYALLWDGSAWVPGAMTVPQTTNRIDDSGNPRMGDDNALRKLD